MSLTLDINLWTQKWHKIDPSQQREFLLMQMNRSQESSFKDIPLIMMSLITEHHLKALALNAAAMSSPARARSVRASSSAAFSPDSTTSSAFPPVDYALRSKQYNFVTPEFILREVWAVLKPSRNEATVVGLKEREERLPQSSPTSYKSATGQSSLNTSHLSGNGSSTTAPVAPTATRIAFQRIEEEYIDEEEKRAAVRREAQQAIKDLSSTVPNPLACDIMDGWSVGPHQIASRQDAIRKAEEALLDVATRVICGIKGIDPDADADEEEYNPYAKAKPSAPKAVRWLAQRLLHSILGYDVLIERHEKLILENFDSQWNAITPLSAILNLLWINWDQRRANVEIHSRTVVEACRNTSFCPSLSWECKECMIVSACANFSFVLFALWVSPKWNLNEVLPQSLVSAKVFFQRKKAVTTGLLMDYLNVKSVYEDVEGEIARQVTEPSPFVRMLIRHIAGVVRTRMPPLQAALEMWSAGPLELPDEEVGEGAGPAEKLLIAATRSWFESLFTAPTPYNTHYDMINKSADAQGGGKPQTPSGRPTSAQMLARLQESQQYGCDGVLLTQANASLFWRHFVAFGWPFVVKLGCQVLQEASSNVPLLIHSQSPLDTSAYAASGGANGPLSIYSNEASGALPPLVTDPNLEALLRKIRLPSNFRPISLLNDFMDGPPYDYIDLNDLRVMQKAFLIAMNRLPSCISDLHATIRRIDQWDQVLYESMREESDSEIVGLLRKWDRLFISANHAKKKTRSILQAIGAEVDAMERILPMAPAHSY